MKQNKGITLKTTHQFLDVLFSGDVHAKRIYSLANATLGVISTASLAVNAWCANSGYDNGPPRSRGPGTGPFWQGEPTDCESIWRHGHYRGTDPDPNIRLQLMHRR